MSSIARTADTNVEADLYAGYAGEAGPIEYEVGAIAYLYPGGDGTGNIYEGTGVALLHFRPGDRRGFSANYAPDQENLAGDNFYLSADARFGIPATPVTLFAQVGRERGSFYGRKFDWSFGAEATRGPFTASLGYYDTDLDRHHLRPRPQRARRHRGFGERELLRRGALSASVPNMPNELVRAGPSAAMSRRVASAAPSSEVAAVPFSSERQCVSMAFCKGSSLKVAGGSHAVASETISHQRSQYSRKLRR